MGLGALQFRIWGRALFRSRKELYGSKVLGLNEKDLGLLKFLPPVWPSPPPFLCLFGSAFYSSSFDGGSAVGRVLSSTCWDALLSEMGPKEAVLVMQPQNWALWPQNRVIWPQGGIILAPKSGYLAPKWGYLAPKWGYFGPKKGLFGPKLGFFCPQIGSFAPKLGSFAPKSGEGGSVGSSKTFWGEKG